MYNTSTLSPGTDTSSGCTRHSVVMSNNSEDLNADQSMDASVTGSTDGSPSLVVDTPDAEPGSKALIGEGLHAQFPKYWFSEGGSKAPSLGRFSRYYMSSKGLSPEESLELEAVTLANSLRESENHSILAQIPFFPKGLVSVDEILLHR